MKEKIKKLKKDTLPKSDIRGEHSNLIFCSSDGVQFPANVANVAKNSPLIRRVLKDWREREEDQVIFIDLDSKALSTVLDLFYNISIPFEQKFTEKVKTALKLFEIDETFVTISSSREKGEEDDGDTEAVEEVNNEDDQATSKRIHEERNIECPFTGCNISPKQRHTFLKHLCDHHFKKEISELMIGSDRSCPHPECQFTTKSCEKRNLRHHLAIKHKHINVFFANTFPKHPLIEQLKLT